MSLTPEWWVPSRPIKLSGLFPVDRPAPAEGATPLLPSTVDAREEELFTKVVRRQKKKATVVAPPVSVAPVKRPAPKPPAVLVKVQEGTTYADTVRALRASGAVDSENIATVAGVRRTREGHVLVEQKRGPGAEDAAVTLRRKLTENLGNSVGPITADGHTTEIEIVDLDAAATREEILTALTKAAADNGASSEMCSAISVTGLWATKRGQQVATASLPPSMASTITRFPLGWIMCWVRPRRPEPL